MRSPSCLRALINKVHEEFLYDPDYMKQLKTSQ